MYQVISRTLCSAHQKQATKAANAFAVASETILFDERIVFRSPDSCEGQAPFEE
jgi:hypothetical protein